MLDHLDWHRLLLKLSSSESSSLHNVRLKCKSISVVNTELEGAVSGLF
jgi:hypothetical protein